MKRYTTFMNEITQYEKKSVFPKFSLQVQCNIKYNARRNLQATNKHISKYIRKEFLRNSTNLFKNILGGKKTRNCQTNFEILRSKIKNG